MRASTRGKQKVMTNVPYIHEIRRRREQKLLLKWNTGIDQVLVNRESRYSNRQLADARLFIKECGGLEVALGLVAKWNNAKT